MLLLGLGAMAWVTLPARAQHLCTGGRHMGSLFGQAAPGLLDPAAWAVHAAPDAQGSRQGGAVKQD